MRASPPHPRTRRGPSGQKRTSPQRRNRSRQRERLLEMLRSTDDHPTAAWLFTVLRQEFPRLSLGTVYRNLDLLIDEGEIDEVPETGGIRRFDGNTAPHHHFVCESCGRIQDVQLPTPRGVAQRLRDRGFTPIEIRIHSTGRCEDCADLH